MAGAGLRAPGTRGLIKPIDLAVTAHLAPASTRWHRKATEMNKKKDTVLIVDDMHVNIALLSQVLKNDYHLKVAKNGEKAITIAQQGDVDLILLDVMMPEMDGYEVCKILKANNSTADIPVIFVTSNTESSEEERGFLLGAADYITKPYHLTTVLSRVKTHLANREKNRLLDEKNRELKRTISLVDKNIIISSTDLDGKITDASEAFCKISGYAKEELIGKSHRVVRHSDMPAELFKDLWATILRDQVWKGEIKNRKKDGGYYWVRASISPIYDDSTGEKVGYTAIRQDITDKKLIEEISITDGLTNIFNRRHFNDVFPKIICSAKRKNEVLSFLLLDIDYFKPYNDNYGHQQGDDVLIAFATALKQTLQRADDYAFRLGGEEFGVIFKSENRDKALAFAQRLRAAIKKLNIPHAFSSVADHITASMGLVCKEAHAIDCMDQIYKEADDLLYASKQSGRDRVTMNQAPKA